jgi:hypothetical protein
MNAEKTKTALDWFYDKIKSHFEHDGDLLETINFTMAIAKQKERDQKFITHIPEFIKPTCPTCGSDRWIKDNDLAECTECMTMFWHSEL